MDETTTTETTNEVVIKTEAEEIKERILEVRKAISVILAGGQEYQIGSKRLKRADLFQLQKLEKDLTSQYNDLVYVHRAYVGWRKS